MNNKKYLFYSTIVAALGGLLFGFDTAVISGTTGWLEKNFDLSSFCIEWRWMFGVEAIPALLFFILLFRNLCSPRWLIAKNRIDEAKLVF